MAANPIGLLTYDLVSHIYRLRDWSTKTFGPGERTTRILAHVRKELLEIEAKPHSLEEWIDGIILLLDGAWRAGYQPEEIAAALRAKHVKNEARQWPDWRTDLDKPIEHIRDEVSTSGDWRVVIDDTGGPFSDWPSVCSDSEDRCVLHVNGFVQEHWGCHTITGGPTLKEALEIAQVVADYMNKRGRLTPDTGAVSNDSAS